MPVDYQTFWQMHDYRAVLADNPHVERRGSLGTDLPFYGQRSYNEFTRSLDNPGVTYAEQIQAIERLSHEVTLQGLPHIADVRRIQSYGRSGHTVRWQALMQGNLAQAWKRTEVQHVHGRKSRVTLLLPCTFDCNRPASSILWTMVANVALAQALERKGTRCEIWAIAYMRHVWIDGADAAVSMRLKTSDSAWNIQDIVPIAHAAWLRRGIFHVLENIQGAHTGLTMNYGICLSTEQLAKPLQAWGKHHELTQCLMGATEHEEITDGASALAWLKATAARMTGGQ